MVVTVRGTSVDFGFEVLCFEFKAQEQDRGSMPIVGRGERPPLGGCISAVIPNRSVTARPFNDGRLTLAPYYLNIDCLKGKTLHVLRRCRTVLTLDGGSGGIDSVAWRDIVCSCLGSQHELDSVPSCSCSITTC